MTMVTIQEAAQLTGKKVGTIRRWCAQNKLPHEKGSPGRGKSTMVNLDVLRRWADLPTDDKHLLSLASDIPQLMAQVIFECWRQADGHDKRKLAGVLCAVWYASSTELLDYLRDKNSAVPDIGVRPPTEIEHLRKIAQNDRFYRDLLKSFHESNSAQEF